MIAAFMGLAAGYWKPIALVLAIVAALAYRGVLVHERDAARRDAAGLAAKNAELKSSVNDLTIALQRQNAAVDSLKAEADQAVAQVNRRAESAARDAAADRTRAESEARRVVHAPIDSGCAAAIRWGNREAEELSRW